MLWMHTCSGYHVCLISVCVCVLERKKTTQKVSLMDMLVHARYVCTVCVCEITLYRADLSWLFIQLLQDDQPIKRHSIIV